MLDYHAHATNRAAKHTPVDPQANRWYPSVDRCCLQVDLSIVDHPLSYHAGTNARAA